MTFHQTKYSIVWATAIVFLVLFAACSDNTSGVDSDEWNPDENGTNGEIIKPPFDGQSGNPGFFLDSWEPKSALIPDHRFTEKPQADAAIYIYVDPDDEITRVSPYLFGNNANTYMTQMINQPDLMHHISSLAPNVIRFPGGNLSNIYFWHADPGNPLKTHRISSSMETAAMRTMRITGMEITRKTGLYRSIIFTRC